MKQQTIKDVQNKILEIMVFIDKLCRENHIDYMIMGGTALGAVRHGGFIPWDDDLDIFMTPSNYRKFKKVFETLEDNNCIIQEWKTNEQYLEYAKVRMNGTTFIENQFKNRKDMHQGIYVDIMILHKAPKNMFIQKIIYYVSKYIVLLGLSQRGWNPKTGVQKLLKNTMKFLPNKIISNLCYRIIYRYDNLTENYVYCYFITKANFEQGIFEKEVIDPICLMEFENIKLNAPNNVKEYLELRYGNYMELPSKEEQEMSVHAEIFNSEKDYSNYIE